MSIRTERVSAMIQREVAQLLQQDFREASQSMITVTGVRVTPDLSIAYVNVSILGESEQQRTTAFRRLDAISSEVRQALAKRIRHDLKRVPEVRFFLDETAQRAARMEELFTQIREERKERLANGEPSGETTESSTA